MNMLTKITEKELQPVPEDIKQVASHSFSIERQILAHVEQSRKEIAQEKEELKAKRIRYEQEKDNERKVAARKIAPGFLDTDTRILKPEQRHSGIQMMEEGEIVQEPLEGKIEKPFDYLKFEQELSPADPWDTPENDFNALRSVLGSRVNYSTPTYTSSPTQYPPRGYQKNEGVYWNIQKNASAQASPSNSVPAIPPKLFNSPSPSTSLPILSHAPPRPPPPSSPEHLIEELNNMGFTRAQATDALEKNQHDLMKATNFLLDQA
ncbi:unnamed protein product [Rhizopus stolonifer]